MLKCNKSIVWLLGTSKNSFSAKLAVTHRHSSLLKVANNIIIGHFSRLLWLGLAQFCGRKPIFRGALLALTLLGCGSAFAFDVNVKSFVSSSQVFIGDIFSYKIEVEVPSAAKVDLPSFVGNLGSFEVKEMQNDRVTEGMPKGTVKVVWNATLNTLVGGDFLIAPQEVEVVVGKDTVKTRTDPVAVKVASRTTGEETDILDVEAPLKDPRLPVWLWWLMGILGAALLVFLGWYLHKKFRKGIEELQLPPYEEAKLALKKMRDRNLLAVGDQAEFFASISFIARRYVQRRFDVDILDATLSQLKKRMAHVVGLQQAYKESVVSLEEETEPVKFAKMKLNVDRCDFWNVWIDRLLDDTRPLPEEDKNKDGKKNSKEGKATPEDKQKKKENQDQDSEPSGKKEPHKNHVDSENPRMEVADGEGLRKKESAKIIDAVIVDSDKASSKGGR